MKIYMPYITQFCSTDIRLPVENTIHEIFDTG